MLARCVDDVVLDEIIMPMLKDFFYFLGGGGFWMEVLVCMDREIE